MEKKNVILTGRMANAGRLLSKEEKEMRNRAQARKMAEQQKENSIKMKDMSFAEAMASGLYNGRIYVVVEENEMKEVVAKANEEENEMKEVVTEGRPVRLESTTEERKSIRAKAQEIRKERIDNAINSFWAIVNENESHVEAELLSKVNSDPLRGSASYSFSVEIEKDAYSELILNAIDNEKPNYVAYWENDGVAAEITTFSKEKNIKVVFSYNLQY